MRVVAADARANHCQRKTFSPWTLNSNIRSKRCMTGNRTAKVRLASGSRACKVAGRRRDEFPNHYVGELVQTDRGCVVVEPTSCPAGHEYGSGWFSQLRVVLMQQHRPHAMAVFQIGVIRCAPDYFNLLAFRQTGPSERPVFTRRKSCSWSLVHDEAKASVDRVEMKDISMAGMPGAGVEILTQAFDPRLDVVGGQPCQT